MTTLAPLHRWRPPSADLPDPDLAREAARLGLGERALRILVGRGDRTVADLAGYLEAPPAGLHDPHLLPDADLLWRRIRAARDRHERVLIFGDFDADGLTGLTIMVEALRALGIDAMPYVPDRQAEGHGLSRAAIEEAQRGGRTLIVTVDTGTTSVAEVEVAVGAGVDVIITDHHHVPERLPPATAIVNPHRPGTGYPDVRLAGTGVAFKVAQLLMSDLPGGAEAALALAELAAIGTVADVAPILGENRVIARLGLRRLREVPRPGIAALLAAARIAPASVDLETIGFAIAPRLNAAGRMGDACVAANLLLASTQAEAEPLAATLEEANRSRRDLTARVLEEASGIVAGDVGVAAVVVVGDWPVGIIGLVAGRLAERSGKPAVVFSRAQEPWRGSARSVSGFDLAAAFDACGAIFERHGGHPQAAGCEIRPERFETFRARFETLVAASPSAAEPTLGLDLIVEALEVDYLLHRELAVLEPTGPGNPRPLLGISGLTVTRARSVSGGHAQLTLRKGREVLDGIAFERPDLAELPAGLAIDLVARLASRTFGGYETLQLEVVDAATSGTLASMMVTP